MRWALFVGIMAVTMTGCAALRARDTRSTEQMLAAAGFHMKFADSSERTADLKTLPARKITVQRQGDGTAPYYVYADPDVCNCMYVGTESQYREYQRLMAKQELADEQLQASMNWGLWGPWPWW